MKKDSFLFTNFIGAMKDSLVNEGYTSAQTNHLIIASLMEIVNDIIHEDNKIDHYSLKPVYRFLLNIQREENTKASTGSLSATDPKEDGRKQLSNIVFRKRALSNRIK